MLDTPPSWWGTFAVADDETRRSQIGPLTLWMRRAPHEWRMAYHREDEPLADRVAMVVPPPGGDEAPAEATRMRFGFRRTADPLHILPALPDHPLVVKPEVPFHLPPREEITLYVSAPLWFKIEVGEPAVPLHEAPVVRPSDTWFGPPNGLGSRCYASRTKARLRFEDIPILPQCAISVVRIRNQAGSALPIERLKLPATHLSLYSSADRYLWTEAVTLDREEEGEVAVLHVGKGAPNEAIGPERVAGARVSPQKGLLLRTFGGLLS